MRTVLLASLRGHARRYVAALVAVTVAVGFVVVTNALASATKSGLSAGVDAAYPGADLVVGETYGVDSASTDAAVALAKESGDRTTVVASGYTPVELDGRLVGSDVSIGTVAETADLRRQVIESGRAPRAPTEALVDAGAARSTGVAIGDVLTLDPGANAVDVTVVGIAAGTSYLSADVYAPWATVSQLPGAYADALVYDVGRGSAGQRADQLRAVVDAPVSTRADYVDERVTAVNLGVDVISYLLLVFAAIAGFVATLVIANTFTILFAQRTRELALLRCVGATRREVLRAVRRESAALALVASTTGVIGGAFAGYGIAAIVRAFAGADRIGPVALSPTWMIAAFAGGVVITLVAAWLPTRAVVRVTPLAALRPQQDVTVGHRAGRIRVALGVAAIGLGTAALVLAVRGQAVAPMLLGGIVSFTGVLVLGPVIVPRLLRVIGRLLSRLGPSVRIASANAVRNPRRSATTTASLLVGVTLATAVLTGLASARGALDDEMDAQHPVDATLTAERPAGPGALESVSATQGVERAVEVPGLRADLGDPGDVTVLAPGRDVDAIVRDRAAITAGAGEVLVPGAVVSSWEGSIPETVRLRVGDRTTELTTRLVGSEWGDAVVVSPATLRELGGTPATLAIWVRAESGVDAETFGGDLGAIGREVGLDAANALESRAYVDLQLDVLVWAVLGLLGVSVAIALVGIANTVGLSVLERGREHALLRALGLTRGQLRRVLAAEGLLLALVAATLGTVIGTAFGWIGVQTVVTVAVEETPFVVPWSQLATVLVGATLAGLLACVLPARRAARIAPAAGLTLD